MRGDGDPLALHDAFEKRREVRLGRVGAELRHEPQTGRRLVGSQGVIHRSRGAVESLSPSRSATCGRVAIAAWRRRDGLAKGASMLQNPGFQRRLGELSRASDLVWFVAMNVGLGFT